jgi:hypothetical protein
MRICKWSAASIALSVASMTVSYATVQYLYRRGAWNPDSVFGRHLQTYDASAILISFVLAVTGMFRDRNVWLGTGALLLSMFAFLTVATG